MLRLVTERREGQGKLTAATLLASLLLFLRRRFSSIAPLLLLRSTPAAVPMAGTRCTPSATASPVTPVSAQSAQSVPAARLHHRLQTVLVSP